MRELITLRAQPVYRVFEDEKSEGSDQESARRKIA